MVHQRRRDQRARGIARPAGAGSSMASVGPLVRALSLSRTSGGATVSNSPSSVAVPPPPPELLTPVCLRCGGIGFYRLDVPVGHPDFGRALRCECQLASDRDRQHRRAQRASNLGGELLRKTFDGYEVSDASTREALDAARSFADHPAGWLVLMGTRGSGKTHLMAAIANLTMGSEHHPLYVVVPDWLEYVRDGYDAGDTDHRENAARRFEEARDAGLLLLDDLGTEKRSEWTDERLYRLLNYRYNTGAPTVVSTNLRFEELEGRIASRLRDVSLSRVVVLTGDDYRLRRRG